MTTKEYHRQWARDNKEKRQAFNNAWRSKQVLIFNEFKKTLKCNRCSESHIATLQFHHTNPSEKEIAISNAVRKWSVKRLLIEIEKCEVLCANCHAIEHYNQRNQE